MTIGLAPLFADQGRLDAHIHENHNLDYPTTRQRRILALLVELGELANETRAFKFWSLKGPSPIEKILDEYADGMHFFLSLGIDVGSLKKDYEISKPDGVLVAAFLKTYEYVIKFRADPRHETYEAAFQTYLDIIPLLNSTPDDIIKAYYAKLGVNYQRQQNKY